MLVLLSACLPAPATPTPVPLAGLECPSDFCRRPDLTSGLYAGCAAETARELEPFRAISAGMDLAAVCARTGPPDWETGSGLMILVYDLADGGRVLVGLAGPDDLFYVRHLAPGGAETNLLGE